MRKSRLRILYVVPVWPHGKSFGKQLRLLHLGRALRELGEVSLVIACDDHDAQAEEETRREFTVAHRVRTEQVPPLGFRERLKWWFDPSFQDPSGSIITESDRTHLIQSLENFDLVWVHSVRAANMFGLWRWPHSVLDIDDVPSTYELTEFVNGKRWIDRLKAGARVVTWRRREKLLQKRFNVLTVCSDFDRQYLGGDNRIHVIPNGFERPLVEPPRKPANPPRLGFIGLFSYLPNVDGVRWFIENCWLKIKKEIPNVRLRLVGKDSDRVLRPAQPDVDGLGWIADPAKEIATWSGMIVPIRLGSGTRLKVAEAFSRKCPLVSTSFGARGYDVTNGEELLLADTPEVLARACIEVIRNPLAAAAMAQRAWLRFLQDWTWDAIAPRVCKTAEHCLRLERTDGFENEETCVEASAFDRPGGTTE
jgi:glycosyltransferase involved in cell wall biosynthesis